jgi:protocatechuate 3,4-dioxygenase beta subunit
MPRFLPPLFLLIALALVAAFMLSSGDAEPSGSTGDAATTGVEPITPPPIADTPTDAPHRSEARVAPVMTAPASEIVADDVTKATLEVIVVAPTGSPVSDATVVVTEAADRSYGFFDGGFGARRSEVGRAATDAEGIARFDVFVARSFDLAVRKDGFANYRRRDVRGGTTVRVDLAYDAEITGRVYDIATNEPLAGASVELGPGRAARTPWTGRPDETTTGADGVYRFTSVAPGAVDLSATHSRGSMGWPLEVEVRPGERVVRDIGLEPGTVITGIVRDATNKEPLANAVLSLGHSPNHLDDLRTDATGHYVFENFPRHAYEFSAHAAGYASERRVVRGMRDDVAAERVDFELRRERRARGVVVDAAGVPLAGVYVAAAASDYAGERNTQRIEWNSTATDKGGAFEIDRIHPEMRPALVVRDEGYATRVFDFPKGDEPLVDFGEIVLTQGAVVEVEVVDEHGAPRDKLAISLVGANADRRRFDAEAEPNPLLDSYVATRTVRADGKGIALFRDVAEGAFEAQAEIPGTHRIASQPFVVKPGERLLRVRLTVDRGYELRGRVRPSDGGAMPKVYVSIDPLDGQGTSGDAECDAEGKFVGTALAPGRYRLTAYPYASDADKRVGRKFESVTQDDVMLGPEEVEIVIPARIEKA